MIDVVDTGTGIAPDIMDKIFEPFFTTKEVGKARVLGCRWSWHHQAVGAAMCFRNRKSAKAPSSTSSCRGMCPQEVPASEPAGIPMSPAAPAAAPQPPQEEPDLTGNSAVVLLVEDEEAVRRGGKRMLETRGYTVHEAGLRVEALDILDELDGQVDVVVSDVVMPEMDGPTLLKKSAALADMKFVFVSGFAEDALRGTCRRLQVRLPAQTHFAQAARHHRARKCSTAERSMTEDARIDDLLAFWFAEGMEEKWFNGGAASTR